METLVAILILVLAITGPLSFSQTGLRTSFVARDQMIAFYLAQDAIEAIKNKRDQNMIDDVTGTVDWLSGLHGQCTSLSDPCDSFNGYGAFSIPTIDPNFWEEIGSCDSGNECLTALRKYNGQYTPFAQGERTEFYRTVYMREIGDDREAQIVVVVKWDTNAYQTGQRQVVVQENIFNWLPR